MRGQILYFYPTKSVFAPAFAPFGRGFKPVSSNRRVGFLFYEADWGLALAESVLAAGCGSRCTKSADCFFDCFHDFHRGGVHEASLCH